jgi:acyl-coenzyme A thioesterase PaaI-like protein
VSPERLAHHELCFGCGRTNLFGLLMDVEQLEPGRVRGRGFVKQDHQGADRRAAHEGIIAAALSEAMALACGPEMRPRQIELHLDVPVAVGVFLDVEAQVAGGHGEECDATATVFVESRAVANARGSYERRA